MQEESSEEVVHESGQTRSRRGIASFLRRIANALRRGEPVPADEAQAVTVDPAAESDLAVEVEREGETVSLEMEIEWEGDEDDIETDAAASKATFELYEDSAEEYRWRLVHDNGNIIADGGEGYASKANAENGIESVKENAAGANLVDESTGESVDENDVGGSDATFELFEDSAEQWRWRLRHDNGHIVADGGQGYSSKQKAKQGLRSVRQNAPGAPVEEGE
jgi:amphi-Trp domain-containing protein